MVICPIALAIHCERCPIVGFCPAKTLIGDYGKVESTDAQKSAPKDKPKADDKCGDSDGHSH